MEQSKHKYAFTFLSLLCMIAAGSNCQKSISAPAVDGPAAFTVINAIPNTSSSGIVPVINSSEAIMWFQTASNIGYGSFYEYSPQGGNDTVYVVQGNGDTLNIGPKASDLLFNNVLTLKTGGIYSLFLCGADTSSPDYLFSTDTLPYHSSTDSTVGIRFVNLSSDSNPISINLEGSPNGSEVGSLLYKGVTGFKDYISNAEVSGYLFVFRDAATGDSLTQIQLTSSGSGLTDYNNSNNLLTFKNVTIAFYGSTNSSSGNPVSVMMVDNY